VSEQRSSTQRRCFLLVTALLLIPASRHTITVYGFFLDQTMRRTANLWPGGQPVGADFLQFAGVAEMWERGRIDELYSSRAQQREFMALAAGVEPFEGFLQFYYPPFAAWLVRPLAPFDYMQRYVMWMLMQLAFVVVALALWRQELPLGAFLVFAVAFAVSPPVLSNLATSQTAFIGLASLSATLFLLHRGRDFAAGFALSLLFYKPTLGIVIGPLLIVARRWWAVLGVVFGAMLLAAASAAVSVQACRDYPAFSRELVELSRTSPSYYIGFFNYVGFVATLLRKPPAEFNWIRNAIVLAPIAVLVWMAARAWCVRWRPNEPRWCAGASAVVLTTVFATPYLFAYDAVIAAVAGVYSVRSWHARPNWHRWYILVCVSLAWFFLAAHNHLAPIPMAAWAVLEARWAMSQEAIERSLNARGN